MTDAVLESVGLASRRAGTVFQARMRRGVRSLAAVAGIAPLVGVFGTVLGMTTSFPGINGTGEHYVEAVMVRLSDAVVPTALGLAVAIFAWWGYRYLIGRLEDFEVEMEAATLALMNQLALRTTRG
jgi:biopolymer transport protein ExbB/TolQ